MDRLQSMRVFEQVVTEGSFAAAARKLDLAPAVVTRLIGDLESHLGVRLLNRTTRRLALTQAGEAYMERLRSILADIDEADASVAAQTRDMRGTIRILAPPLAATHVLAPAIVSFQKEHPAVNVEVHVEDNADPAVHEYDLAILGSSMRVDSEVITRPILISAGVFCASPDYLKRHGEPREPEDLLRHRCLRVRMPGERMGPMRLINPEDGDRTVEMDLPTVMVGNHAEMILRATVKGGGISSQPIDLVAASIRAGQLRRVLAPWITRRLALTAAIPSRKYMPLRTRAFIDHLVAHARRIVGGLGVDIGPEQAAERAP